MIFNEPTRVFPEDDELEPDKNPFIIEETKVRKKKRRFILYFLIVLITFIIVRVILIAITVYKLYNKLDFDMLLLNNMKYDSKNPESLSLDVQIGDVCSPLFVRIKDIECDVYANDEKGGLDRMCSLNIPDIEIVKYKTLCFKNDISFKNVDPNIIDKWSNTKKITVKSKGKLYYRVCLMVLHINWENKKTIRVRDDNNKLRLPKIDEVKIRNLDDRISLGFTMDHNTIKLPPYLDITMSKTELRCGEDLPCSFLISELVAENGIFKSPFIITVEIKKEDYGVLIDTLLKYFNNETIRLGIKELVMDVKDKLKRRVQLELSADFTAGVAGGMNIPPATLDGVSIENQTVMCNIKIDPLFLSILDRNTKLIFQGVEINAEARMFGDTLGNVLLLLSSEKGYINLAIAVTCTDLQKTLDYAINGDLDLTFELGNEKKKHSLLRGLLIYYNPNRIALRYNDKYLEKKFEKKESLPNAMSHYVSSNKDFIKIQSTIYRGRSVVNSNKPLLIINQPRLSISIQHKFFSGELIFIKAMYCIEYGPGFVGDVITELNLRPKMYMIRNTEDINDLLALDFLLEFVSPALKYHFKDNTKGGDQSSLLKSFIIEYKEALDFKNHIISVSGSQESFPKILANNTIKISKNLLEMGIYTSGILLTDTKPNITLNEFVVDLKSKEDQNTPAFKTDVNLYIGSLDVLKSLMYGEFHFYSKKNAFSYVIAQYLNNLMSQGSTYGNKTIIPGECKFDLKIKGTESTRLNPSIYTGIVKLSVPLEVVRSFKLCLFKIPKMSFLFLTDDNPSAGFNLMTEHGNTIVFGFKINPNMFTAGSQQLLWESSIDGVKKTKRFSSTSKPVLKFLRMFFLKVFELPKISQKKASEPRIGLAIAHDEIEVKDHTSDLETRACVVLYADPMDEFFFRTIPEILLKCGFSKVPKYFKIEMSSDRLELMNAWLEPKGRFTAIAENVECSERFYLEYPSGIEIEYNGEHNTSQKKDESHLFNYIPRDITKSKSKLTFTGDVSLISHQKEKEMLVSNARVDYPFPIFLVDIMKEPVIVPLNFLFRASLLDVAISMPFSLGVYAKDKIKYELFYKEMLILKDEVIGDQGFDRFLHFSFRSLHHPSAIKMFGMVLNREKEPFTLKLTQGDKTLLEYSFILDTSVHENIEYSIATLLSCLSQWFKNNKKNWRTNKK